MMDLHINIRKQEGREYILLEFDCGLISPEELSGYTPLDPVKEGFSDKGVILKGGMPQWLLSYYTHILHTTRFIAVSVPRTAPDAAVVVASHSNGHKPGDIIYY